MAEIKRVKISHVIKSQIPEFLNQESPKFASFLKQYYASQEHKSGVIDLANNLPEYRQISAFNSESLIASTTLTAPIFAASTTINVTSTTGWPDTYGLLKIGEEIITYTGKTATSFTGCVRGFCGVDNLKDPNNPETLVFSNTSSSKHENNSKV